MKWTTPPVYRIQSGDVKRRIVFALLPHDANDGRTYWLCRIVKVEAALLDHYDGLSWDHRHWEPYKP